MKAPKGVVRPLRHRVTIELTDVQASALRCVAKRILRAYLKEDEQGALSRCAEVMLVTALSDVRHLLTASDRIVRYCEQEGLTKHAAARAVYDDRVAAAFRNLPWETSTKRGER